MKLNPLGQTGILVSALGWGTVKLGRDQNVKYPENFTLPDDEQALNLLGLARELGINLIDTAPAYGTSEERLGKLLQKRRHDWVISTKVGEDFTEGESSYDFTPAHLKFSAARSLRRLRTDYLDLVLVHSNGNDSEIIERYEVFDTLAELKRAGWIRAFGMSSKTIAGGLLTARYADAAMVTYNPQHLDELEVIDACQRLGKGVLIKKAFASGHLHTPSEDTVATDHSSKAQEAQKTEEWQTCDTQDNDPVQTNLNMVLGHPGVSSAIVGTINPQHLRDNVNKALLALKVK
jgi:aryl-alcohol dehydrogenase-like predicted oxidoreductase